MGHPSVDLLFLNVGTGTVPAGAGLLGLLFSLHAPSRRATSPRRGAAAGYLLLVVRRILAADGSLSAGDEAGPGGEGIVRRWRSKTSRRGWSRGLRSSVSSQRAQGQALLVGGMSLMGAAVSGHAVSALNQLIPSPSSLRTPMSSWFPCLI